MMKLIIGLFKYGRIPIGRHNLKLYLDLIIAFLLLSSCNNYTYNPDADLALSEPNHPQFSYIQLGYVSDCIDGYDVDLEIKINKQFMREKVSFTVDKTSNKYLNRFNVFFYNSEVNLYARENYKQILNFVNSDSEYGFEADYLKHDDVIYVALPYEMMNRLKMVYNLHCAKD